MFGSIVVSTNLIFLFAAISSMGTGFGSEGTGFDLKMDQNGSF